MFAVSVFKNESVVFYISTSRIKFGYVCSSNYSEGLKTSEIRYFPTLFHVLT